MSGVEFDAASHTYTVDGTPVEKSCTTLVHENFERFDARAIVDRHFGAWKARGDPRYAGMISASKTDEAAKRVIIESWAMSAALGTLTHACAEVLMAGACDTALFPGCEHESSLIRAFLATSGLTPCFAELPVWYSSRDTVVCAGTVDALFTNGAGQHVLVDWKRVKRPLEGSRVYRNGSGPLSHVGDTSLNKYSLQLSVYSHMLKCSRGIDVGDRMLLVRVYPGMLAPETTIATDYRAEAEVLLDAELARLSPE